MNLWVTLMYEPHILGYRALGLNPLFGFTGVFHGRRGGRYEGERRIPFYAFL